MHCTERFRLNQNYNYRFQSKSHNHDRAVCHFIRSKAFKKVSLNSKSCSTMSINQHFNNRTGKCALTQLRYWRTLRHGHKQAARPLWVWACYCRSEIFKQAGPLSGNQISPLQNSAQFQNKPTLVLSFVPVRYFAAATPFFIRTPCISLSYLYRKKSRRSHVSHLPYRKQSSQ